jgi:hypothetical protein
LLIDHILFNEHVGCDDTNQRNYDCSDGDIPTSRRRSFVTAIWLSVIT